ARPDQLGPAPAEDEHDSRPLAEAVRVGELRGLPAGERAVEGARGLGERADRIPDVADEAGHDPETDPEVHPDEHRHRVLEEDVRLRRRRRETGEERVEEEDGRDDEPDASQPGDAEGPRAPGGALAADREHRCGSRRQHREPAGKDVDPDRKREAIADLNRVSEQVQHVRNCRFCCVNPATLPYAWYADEDVFRLEQERIFEPAWHYAGHLGEAAEPGHYFTTRAGRVPLVIVRGRDGGLGCFVNVCRPRGFEVAQGCGRRETLQCAYHAWTYDLDGSLRAAPRSDREPEFPREELGLKPASVARWGPFVFVNTSSDAPP